MFVIKIKTLKFYAHTFLSYNDKAGGRGSNIIGRYSYSREKLSNYFYNALKGIVGIFCQGLFAAISV